jgi:hypothetical protein
VLSFRVRKNSSQCGKTRTKFNSRRRKKRRKGPAGTEVVQSGISGRKKREFFLAEKRGYIIGVELKNRNTGCCNVFFEIENLREFDIFYLKNRKCQVKTCKYVRKSNNFWDHLKKKFRECTKFASMYNQA